MTQYKFNAKLTQQRFCANATSAIIRSDNTYKGAVENIVDLSSLKAFDNDYADVYETNTRWIFEDGLWSNTNIAITYNHNLQATMLPIDDSFDIANIGISKRFALEDHQHKQLHDDTKLNVTDFNDANANLSKQLNDEIDRATKAEGLLQQNIDSTKTELQQTITTTANVLQQNIDTLKANVEQNIDDSLQAIIGNATTNANTLGKLENLLLNEVEIRGQSDDALQANINNEIDRATNAETVLQRDINAENERAQQAEQILKTHLENEISNRLTSDETLTNAIQAEENARITNDNKLNAAIVAEIDRAKQAENILNSDIEAEVTRSTNAEKALDGKIVDTKTELQTKITNETNRAMGVENSIKSNIDDIESKIPTQASATNQLADKDFVNSSITNMAARYMTPDVAGDEQWQSFSALNAGPWYFQGVQTTPTLNDYAIYINADKSVWRASYNGTSWDAQYKVNDSPFTAEQLAAINSGITSNLITTYNGHIGNKTNPHNVTKSQIGLGNVNNTSDLNKPVSALQAEAIADAKKAGTDAQSAIDMHIADVSNPHSVTKSQIGLTNVVNERQYSSQNPPPYPVTSVAGKSGDVTLVKADVDLGNVDNTSDLNKPISIATQKALDDKQPKGNYALKNEIPTSLSGLQTDEQHRVVTDTQINTWNGKSNFSGNYNDLSNKPTIPSKTSQLTNDSRFIQNGKTVNLDKELIFTDTVNPYIKMFSDDKYLFIQAYDSKLMLGDPLKGLHIEMATGNTITKNNLKVEGSLVYKGKELVDLIYPVGSIYMSVNSTNPETLFTGTKWSKIEGKFLLGSSSSYGLGTSGGESTHKLTTDEMPSHTHTFTGNSSTTSSDGAHTHKYQKPYMTARQVMGGSGSRFTNFESVDTTSAGAHTHTVTASGTNSSTGGGVAHNNMPPYLAVNIWKRTS